MTIAAHIVTPDAAEASKWYQQALGAEEIGSVPLPGGKLMAVAMRLAGSDFHVASEFPDAGIWRPHRSVERRRFSRSMSPTRKACGIVPLRLALIFAIRWAIRFGVSSTASSPIRSVIAGTSLSACVTYHPKT